MFRKQEAVCYLQEFVVWSIKQSGSSAKANVNIRSLLSRLSNYICLHLILDGFDMRLLNIKLFKIPTYLYKNIEYVTNFFSILDQIIVCKENLTTKI